MSKLKVALAFGVSAAVLTVAAPAIAADAAAQAGAQPPVSTVESVVVTAQRRAESANTVGMSIEAFHGEQLQQLHVTGVKDLSSVAPSFNVSQGYQGVPIYTLRGIGFNTINLSATSTVGTYVDEVAYAYPFMNTGPIFDLERVEVLKGPQGTLYGRNTTAGLIDFVTNKPTKDVHAAFTTEFGNYSTHNFEGFVSGPLGDKVQGRVAFRTDDSDDGWQKSNTRDETLGQIHRYGLRAALAVQPTDRFTADVSFSGWWNRSDTTAAQAIGFTPATDPATGANGPFNAAGVANYVATHFPTSATQADWEPETLRGADQGKGLGLPGPLREDDSFYAGKIRLGYEINDNMKLVSLTGYNWLKRDALFDWSGAPYEILVQHAQGKISSVSEELHLEGDSGPVHWLVGGYYGHDSILDGNRTMLGDNANVGLIRFYTNMLLATPFNTGGYTAADAATAFRTYSDVGHLQTTTGSVFGNADWKISDQFKVTAGIRYTRDRQDFSGCSLDFNGDMLANVNITNRYLFDGVYGLVPTISQGQCVTFNPSTKSFGLVTSTLDEDNVAWRVVGNWTPQPGLLIYGSISRGAKAGDTPINAANISTQDAPARQELLTAYELGVKAGLFERRMQVNASVFYYDYKDKQLSVYFADPIYTALARLSNIPHAKAYGLDADVTWRLSHDFTAIGAVTYIHTEIGHYVGINGAGQSQDFSGASFPYSPSWQGSLTLTYDHPISEKLGFQAAVNTHLQTRSHADLGEDPNFAIRGYGLLNASLGVHSLSDRWEVSLWARNLTNTYYWNSVASNANLVVRFPAQPRTFGASLTVKY